MKEIKTQTVYICPETGKKCRSKAEAQRSAEAAIKAKEEARIAAEQAKLVEASNLEKCDWLRLNLENVEDIPALMTQKAKEFWGIDFEVKIRVWFGEVSNSHHAPIGKKTNWSGRDNEYPKSFPGWSGQIVGSIKNYKVKKNGSDSVSGLLFGDYNRTMGFRGFHTGTGCPGSLHGEYPMDIGFSFFLEDFPLLKSKYDRFQKDAKVIYDYNEGLLDVVYEGKDLANKQKEVLDLDSQIRELSSKRYQLYKKFKDDYVSDHMKETPAISSDYADLQGMFTSYYRENDKINFLTPQAIENMSFDS